MPLFKDQQSPTEIFYFSPAGKTCRMDDQRYGSTPLGAIKIVSSHKSTCFNYFSNQFAIIDVAEITSITKPEPCSKSRFFTGN